MRESPSLSEESIEEKETFLNGRFKGNVSGSIYGSMEFTKDLYR